MTNFRKLGASAVVVVAVTFGAVSVASAVPVSHRGAVVVHTTKKVKFTGTYTGTISLLINGTKVTATSVAGSGSATWLGKSTMAGHGTSSTAAQCEPLNGTGALTGSGSKLNLTILTKSTGCGSGYTAPTTVNVSGTAKVTSGAGKFKGATGTLSFSGHFTLPSTTAKSNDKFTAKLTGTLTTKS